MTDDTILFNVRNRLHHRSVTSVARVPDDSTNDGTLRLMAFRAQLDRRTTVMAKKFVLANEQCPLAQSARFDALDAIVTTVFANRNALLLPAIVALTNARLAHDTHVTTSDVKRSVTRADRALDRNHCGRHDFEKSESFKWNAVFSFE